MRRSREGMVTVEAALAMVGVILVLAMCLAALGTVRRHTALCQAVREAARAAALGDSPEATGREAFGAPVELVVSPVGNWIHVQGSAPALELAGLQIGLVKCRAAVLSEVLW